MSMCATERCPGCRADLRGDPIPAVHRHYYGGKTHFSRVIGVEYGYGEPESYDGVSEWRCPDCGYREGRWSGRRLAPGEPEPRFGRVVAERAA